MEKMVETTLQKNDIPMPNRGSPPKARPNEEDPPAVVEKDRYLKKLMTKLQKVMK